MPLAIDRRLDVSPASVLKPRLHSAVDGNDVEIPIGSCDSEYMLSASLSEPQHATASAAEEDAHHPRPMHFVRGSSVDADASNDVRAPLGKIQESPTASATPLPCSDQLADILRDWIDCLAELLQVQLEEARRILEGASLEKLQTVPLGAHLPQAFAPVAQDPVGAKDRPQQPQQQQQLQHQHQNGPPSLPRRLPGYLRGASKLSELSKASQASRRSRFGGPSPQSARSRRGSTGFDLQHVNSETSSGTYSLDELPESGAYLAHQRCISDFSKHSSLATVGPMFPRHHRNSATAAAGPAEKPAASGSFETPTNGCAADEDEPLAKLRCTSSVALYSGFLRPCMTSALETICSPDKDRYLKVKSESSGWLLVLLHTPAFNIVCTMMIFVNCVFIGEASSCGLQHELFVKGLVGDDCDMFFGHKAQSVCFAFFVVELLLRAVAEKEAFFIGCNALLNMLDLMLLVSGVLSIFSRGSEQMRSGSISLVPNMTALRILRIADLIQFFRSDVLSRVSRNFRMMVMALTRSASSLVSATLTLIIVVYLFAVAFAGRIEFALRNNDIALESMTTLQKTKFIDFYGSFGRAMVSLLVAIFGGEDWTALADPVVGQEDTVVLWYTVFVGFVMLAPLNVITGIFVDSATQISQMNREVQVQEQMERNRQMCKNLKTIFEEADEDKSGTLSWEEFSNLLEHERTHAYLSTLELNIADAKVLFKMVDCDKTGEVAIDDFIDGCMRMQGVAKSVDLCTLLFENRRQGKELSKLNSRCGAMLDLAPVSPCSQTYLRQRRRSGTQDSGLTGAGPGGMSSIGDSIASSTGISVLG